MGFLFEDKREKLNKKIDNWSKWKYILFILEIGAIFIIFKIFDYESNIYLKIIRSLLNIVLAIIEISLIYIIAYKLSKIEKIVQNKIIKKISEYSFGIYLYSDPINYILLFIMSNNLSQYINTTAGIIGLYFSRVFITFSISIIITYVLRNMKMKYIC